MPEATKVMDDVAVDGWEVYDINEGLPAWVRESDGAYIQPEKNSNEYVVWAYPDGNPRGAEKKLGTGDTIHNAAAIAYLYMEDNA